MFDVYADNDRLSNSDQMIVFEGKCNSRLDTPSQSTNNNAHLNIARLRVDIKCQRCTTRHYICILMTVILFLGILYFYFKFQQLARDLNEIRVQVKLLQGKSNNRLKIYRHKGLSSTFTTETTKKVSSNIENADFYDFSDSLPHNRYNQQMKELHLVRERKETQEVQGFRGRGSFNRKRRSPKHKKDKNAKEHSAVYINSDQPAYHATEDRGLCCLHLDKDYYRVTKKTAIELEGYKTSEGKHSWKLAEWVPQKSQYFDHSNGEILIKKSGFYLMYAQITLIGSMKRGFYVKKMSRTADGTYVSYIISTCTRFSDEEESSSRNDSCSVHRPCRLDAGDKLLIEPISSYSDADPYYEDINSKSWFRCTDNVHMCTNPIQYGIIPKIAILHHGDQSGQVAELPHLFISLEVDRPTTNNPIGLEFVEDRGGSILAIRVTESGFYMVYSKIHAKGRKSNDNMPNVAVGYRVKVDRQMPNRTISSFTLSVSFITQDNRGKHYLSLPVVNGHMTPVDEVTDMGVYYLEDYDEIYIQASEESNNFAWLCSEDKANFGILRLC